MYDLISRQAAIEFIKDHSYPVRYDKTSIEQGMTITGIEQALNEVPTVQPEQKTGIWIDDNDFDEYYGKWFECSVCHGVSMLGNYCPDCGAYMKGESNDKTTSNGRK